MITMERLGKVRRMQVRDKLSERDVLLKKTSHDCDYSALANAAQGQTQHQRIQLWTTQRYLRLNGRVWPGKVALVQSPGGQPETNSIMHQHLHAVGPLVGKQVGGVGVGCAEDGDYACQAGVNAASHVQGLCGEPHSINANHANTSRSHRAHWPDA